MTAAPSAAAAPSGFDLAIDGMTCAACVGRVERALRATPGVTAATVNLATGRARVETTRGGAAPAAAAEAVAAVGYAPRTMRLRLSVAGMTCASCVGRVERALRAAPGVRGASVNLATGEASVEALEGAVTPAALIDAVAAVGYPARLAETAGPAAPAETDREPQRRALILAAALTLPLFALEMGGHIYPAFHHWLYGLVGARSTAIAQFALASVVLFGPGRIFFAKGWPALIRGAPDMNALVMLGTAAAWSYSTVATFAPGALPAGAAHLYFEAAAVIVTLVLLGRWLEARARGRAGAAIARLMERQPRSARVLEDGREVETPVAALAVGDLIRVRPGEKPPVDGEVTAGSTWIDEALVTGEPVPVAKGPGDRVIGGTINTTGGFDYRATRVGADTLLAQIVRLVAEAQADKLPIQALVDRVTLWFVPAVMAAAALTFAAWMVFAPAPALGPALVAAVAVLIVACPCAMGLATPVSILVGTGRAAELGLLFRRGAALQGLSGVEIVAFDKTGTLTEGRPRLTDLVPAPGFERDETLALAAAVEARSEHPVARAIAEAATGLTLEPAEDFRSEPGLGVEAMVGGRTVLVGADRFLASRGVVLGDLAPAAARLASLGRTPVFAAVDGRAAAVLAVADAIKPSAAAALTRLRAQGLDLAMVTGDDARAARAIAAELDIERVTAEAPPGGKVDAVKALQAGGRRVAFVGDGVNDAAALAQADVGVAIGSGSDVAIEAADVVVISGDLGRVPDAVALARATLRNIRQNLFWAFAYNAALIPVAAGALYPGFGVALAPALAAGAMALSSVCVVGNALRLRWFRAAGAAVAAPAREALA